MFSLCCNLLQVRIGGDFQDRAGNKKTHCSLICYNLTGLQLNVLAGLHFECF